MKIDMSEMKSMMDMFKNMGEGENADMEESDEVIMEDMDGSDDGEVQDIVLEEPPREEDGGMMEDDADPSKMGEEFAKMTETLERVKGLTNVQSINDTAAYVFGYSFDFQDIASLNKGLELVNKEKFDAKAEDVYSLSKKKFTRSGAANFGEEIKRALSEGEGEEGMEESMDMMKMFFGEMTYKTIYHFDRKIKSSSNDLSEIGPDGKTVTITMKPFSEDHKNKGVATDIKLK